MAATAKQQAGPPAVRITTPDFEKRLELATKNDTAKGMFFNGVVQAVGGLIDEGAAQTVLAASGEKKFVDFFNYPIATFLRMSFTAAELLAPVSGGHHEAFRRLGDQATNDFFSTAVGKTLLMLAGRDPRRLLGAIPGAFKTCVSYGDRKVEFQSDRAGTMTMLRDFMPYPYHEGVLEAAVRAMGVKDVQVKGRPLGQLDAAYDLSWIPADDGGES